MESFGKSNASRINDLGCHFRILRSGWLLTFTTALMDFLDPIRRFADATTARVKRRNATQRKRCLPAPSIHSLHKVYQSEKVYKLGEEFS
jgi:hypothetical protein